LIGINAQGAAFSGDVPQCGIRLHDAKALTDVNELAAFGASMRGRLKKQHPSHLYRPGIRAKR